MKATLQFASIITLAVSVLLVHRAGMVYSVRVIGNWWYSLAFAAEHFRREFARLNAEARTVRDRQEVTQ